MAARKKPARKPDLSVVGAVTRDLAKLKRLDSGLAESGLAAAALALAREIDDPGNSATSKSMCSRSLIDVFDRLWELAPEEEMSDGLDDLAAKRVARRAKAAG